MDIEDIRGILASLPKDSTAAVAIKDLAGRYVFANREYGHYAGTAQEDVVGRVDDELFGADQAAVLHAGDQNALAGRTGVSAEVRIVRNGTDLAYMMTRFPIFDEDRRPIALGIVAMDMSQQRRRMMEMERALEATGKDIDQLRHAIRSLEEQAGTDRLTMAWNRRRFAEEIEVEIHRSSRYGHPLSLLLFDLDHFKAINDRYGHQKGDQVLVEVTARVRDAIRKTDSLTRWGGEEFVVLMPNTSLHYARLLAERIRAHVASVAIAGLGTVTVSLGVAEYLPTDTQCDWLERADQAMYRAKRNGRNRVEYDESHGEIAITEHIESGFVRLIWRESFLSGHPLIDRQHQGLFKISNELLEAVLSGRPDDETSQVVARLLEDVKQHFEDEEHILADLAYVELPQHAAEHGRLLTRGLELAQAFEAGTLSPGQLFQFLAYDVVTRHILRADRGYFPLTANPASASPS